MDDPPHGSRPSLAHANLGGRERDGNRVCVAGRTPMWLRGRTPSTPISRRRGLHAPTELARIPQTPSLGPAQVAANPLGMGGTRNTDGSPEG